ncbi:hypothetical protein RN001_010217 [Aquatica leii]|uniref:Epoxide hydrolase n=1 Tax=Aquatica leii TaxID=1421715 RepID=A0AAN7S8H2_9COLE|nr:hypothetical protein RN001_010217 [Aquatica leii]
MGIKINSILEAPPIPNLENEYWGPGLSNEDDFSIKPFKINVSDQVLDVLKAKLNQPLILTQPLEGVQQQYGMNTNLLTKVIEFWKTKYNWREREQYLNKFPQFKTKIQGLDIHFIHSKPAVTDGKDVVPILLLHGWPGSVREFYELIPILTKLRENKNFVFEVIVPSLPGFGFSDGAVKPGLGVGHMSAMFKILMNRLGFDKFYVHGGNWGFFIGQYMSAFYPNHVLGFHSNMCMSQAYLSELKLVIGSIYPPLVVDKSSEHRMYPLSHTILNYLLELGYVHLHATKPDTIGIALRDSPVGLAAHILEKFSTWTNRDWKNREDGGLELKFKYADLLDNVMIYWVTGCITTSIRLYSEHASLKQFGTKWDQIPVQVPTACVRFENDLAYFSETILEGTFKKLVQINDVQNAGHFAAFEEPELMANDIWSAVDQFRRVHKEATI